MFDAVAVVREFRKRHDNLKESFRAQLTPRSMLSYVNNALDQYVRHRVASARSDQGARYNLTNQEIVGADCVKNGEYLGSPAYDLPSEMFHVLSNTVTARQEGCPAVTVPVHIVSLSEFSRHSKNSNFRTDLAIEWVLGARTSRQIIIDAPKNIIVQSIKADGYRVPRECHAPSLVEDNTPYVDDQGNTISVDRPLEIEGRDAFAIIVGAAVAMSALDKGDPEASARVKQLFDFSRL